MQPMTRNFDAFTKDNNNVPSYNEHIQPCGNHMRYLFNNKTNEEMQKGLKLFVYY